MFDENLYTTWCDSAWINVLNGTNVLDYFAERSNRFYDRNCNNEILRMQGRTMDQLINIQGIEYTLLHVQEPILYVIRKQHRYSPTQVSPICDYYVLVGVVYQAPDLCSVLNARILNATTSLQSAFDEVLSFSRYHSSKGYSWSFPNSPSGGGTSTKKEDGAGESKAEPSSFFQRQRVDHLLAELHKQFPAKPGGPAVTASTESTDEALKEVFKSEVNTTDTLERTGGQTGKIQHEKKTKGPR